MVTVTARSCINGRRKKGGGTQGRRKKKTDGPFPFLGMPYSSWSNDAGALSLSLFLRL